jgi:glycine C-acetyltransferase
MPLDRIHRTLQDHLNELEEKGTGKGTEDVVVEVLPAAGDRGPRYRLEGQGETGFIKMNSNGYLGLSLHPEVIAAEEEVSRAVGTGPGAVRFISGTYRQHVELERRLAAFHGREAAMAFSSAYATVMGILPALVTERTVVISDELNHNCIINAMRLARPAAKEVYGHNDMKKLEGALAQAVGKAERAIVVTDGIFSMRGDHAPLATIVDLARRYDAEFPENVVVMVDDSHGVGAFGETGRGTEEYTGARADVLVATLGKALGVNGGYVVGSETMIRFLRETSPFYIYSNPITPAEAAAAGKAVEVLDGEEGRRLLRHLHAMTKRFEKGLVDLGYETIAGDHPVTPLMVRDTARTARLVGHLKQHGVLATGLKFPVVPRGDETIRFQVSADHTAADIDQVLSVLESFPERDQAS